MKKLEDMDMLDDFLNNCAASSRDSEEIYRIILETLLEKPLGNIRIEVQKPINMLNPARRGIRLDVAVNETGDSGRLTTIYDYEPHRGYILDMPKVLRYRQATIDSNSVPSGSNDFNKLPDLYIIYILDYDPFNEDQLVYSVIKHIKEAPIIPYDDGVHILYFNTTGHLGGSQTIRNMLSYICNSRSENATDEATSQLDKYVSTIKASAEVRDEYMTWDEFVQREVKLEIDRITQDLSTQIAEKNSEIAEKDSEIAEKDSKIS